MATKHAARGPGSNKPASRKTQSPTAPASHEVDSNSTRHADEGIRPSPRPVRVDEEGRLFEMDGTPIVMPGLEPEHILKGIEDERAGRLRSLEEYIASRKQNVV